MFSPYVIQTMLVKYSIYS